MSYRIVTLIDIEASSPAEAYKKLHEFMAKTEGTDLDWESSDEWYDSDGNPLSLEEQSKAREPTMGTLWRGF